MNESDDIKTLLIEIRDAQREHLEEYRTASQRALELQTKAVERQEQIGNLYKRMVVFGLLLITFIVILIFYLLGKMR